MFDNLVWQKDRLLLGDLVFRLQHYVSDNWDLGDRCFSFYKIKELVDQYEAFFGARATFRPRSILELGLWDGGSLAFWFEQFKPAKHVGIDIKTTTESAYFKRYVQERGLERRIKTYWGVDQADAMALRGIVAREFDGPLDLVIDDASHVYGPTKRSFECLFPMLAPGGLYIIEDWAWEHWKECAPPIRDGTMRRDGLTRLVGELIEATGTPSGLVRSATIHQGFAVIERGDAVLAEPARFRLEDHIYRRADPTRFEQLYGALRRVAGRRLRALQRTLQSTRARP